jgi:hypothetical protein
MLKRAYKTLDFLFSFMYEQYQQDPAGAELRVLGIRQGRVGGAPVKRQ